MVLETSFVRYKYICRGGKWATYTNFQFFEQSIIDNEIVRHTNTMRFHWMLWTIVILAEELRRSEAWLTSQACLKTSKLTHISNVHYIYIEQLDCATKSLFHPHGMNTNNSTLTMVMVWDLSFLVCHGVWCLCLDHRNVYEQMSESWLRNDFGLMVLWWFKCNCMTDVPALFCLVSEMLSLQYLPNVANKCKKMMSRYCNLTQLMTRVCPPVHVSI